MYGYRRQLSMPFAEALERLRSKIKENGFSIAAEIDVSGILNRELDMGYERYMIVSVCDARLACDALRADKDIGALLPCNIAIYAIGNSTVVSAVLPTGTIGAIGNEQLRSISEVMERHLKRIVAEL